VGWGNAVTFLASNAAEAALRWLCYAARIPVLWRGVRRTAFFFCHPHDEEAVMLRSFLAWFALLLSIAASFSAYAAQRTFVSTTGSDANTASNCSTTAPCRGFTAALTVTDAGGEIIVLSSGGYGPVTINKSVSIIAPEGIYAGISVFSGDGIYVATAGIDVVLRGLTINGLGGTRGIYMTAGNSLVVQNCTIKNFTTEAGIRVNGAIEVRVLDSLLHRNLYGAYLENGITALISGSRFIDNSSRGLYALASGAGAVTKIEVNRSEASGSNYGFHSVGLSGGYAELNVKESAANRNEYGVYSQGTGAIVLASVTGSLISGNTTAGLLASGSGAKLVASGNTVTHNYYGLYQASSGVLQSAGDNIVSDNTTATFGSITSLAKM
jgi:hypothetical protein